MAKGRKPNLFDFSGGADWPPPIENPPPAPEWLPPDAKEEWNRVVPELVRRRMLEDGDFATVENYCIAVGQIRDCQRQLSQLNELWVQSDRSAPRAHPAIKVMHDCMTLARQLAGELGLTPVARRRIGQKGEGGDDGGGWSDLVDG